MLNLKRVIRKHIFFSGIEKRMLEMNNFLWSLDKMVYVTKKSMKTIISHFAVYVQSTLYNSTLYEILVTKSEGSLIIF